MYCSFLCKAHTSCVHNYTWVYVLILYVQTASILPIHSLLKTARQLVFDFGSQVINRFGNLFPQGSAGWFMDATGQGKTCLCKKSKISNHHSKTPVMLIVKEIMKLDIYL